MTTQVKYYLTFVYSINRRKYCCEVKACVIKKRRKWVDVDTVSAIFIDVYLNKFHLDIHGKDINEKIIEFPNFL